MTDEYIRKQDAVDVASEDGKKIPTVVIRIMHDIKALPAADVAPVVHSRWIKTEDGAECENCGREAVYQIVGNHWEYEPWCPHCGAKMDAQEEG